MADHIRKELEHEILPLGDDEETSSEWVDVVILAFDGLTRALVAEGVSWDVAPQIACAMMVAKQSKNEQRTWPDWRTADPNKAIEHDRSHD